MLASSIVSCKLLINILHSSDGINSYSLSNLDCCLYDKKVKIGKVMPGKWRLGKLKRAILQVTQKSIRDKFFKIGPIICWTLFWSPSMVYIFNNVQNKEQRDLTWSIIFLYVCFVIIDQRGYCVMRLTYYSHI